jgi:hypothetical protein
LNLQNNIKALSNNFFDVKILKTNNRTNNPKMAKYPISGKNQIPNRVTINAPIESRNFSTMNRGAVLVLGILNLSFKICDLKSSPTFPGVIPSAPLARNI